MAVKTEMICNIASFALYMGVAGFIQDESTRQAALKPATYLAFGLMGIKMADAGVASVYRMTIQKRAKTNLARIAAVSLLLPGLPTLSRPLNTIRYGDSYMSVTQEV